MATKTTTKKTTKVTTKEQEFNDVPVPRPDFHNLSVEELYEELKIAIKNGQGKKKILLSNDDEGNGFHLMFYSISPARDCVAFPHDLPYSIKMKDIDNYVVLG